MSQAQAEVGLFWARRKHPLDPMGVKEGRKVSRGNGGCSVVVAGLNTGRLLGSRVESRALKPVRGQGGF